MLYKSAVTAGLIALAIQIFAVGILAPRLPREVCPPGFQKYETFSLPVAKTFHLVNADGTVRVSVGEGPGIEVTADARAYTPASDQDPIAAQYLESLFKTERSEDEVTLITEPLTRPDELDVRVDYLVTVPKGTDLVISIENGNVWIAGGCNAISVEGNNSDVEIQQASGPVSVKSTNGRIRMLDGAGETTLETVNGNIHAGMRAGTLQASTITGAIITHMLSPEVASCDLTSLNGGITLVMSEGCSAEVSAATNRGSVRLDAGLSVSAGILKRRTVLGVIGDGATKLSMNSMNGDIVLQRSTT